MSDILGSFLTLEAILINYLKYQNRHGQIAAPPQIFYGSVLIHMLFSYLDHKFVGKQ
jgi:hypothetical protein